MFSGIQPNCYETPSSIYPCVLMGIFQPEIFLLNGGFVNIARVILGINTADYGLSGSKWDVFSGPLYLDELLVVVTM